MMSSLPISSSQTEGNFLASKWIHLPVLASTEELQKLFHLWGESLLFLLGSPLKKEEIELNFPYFLETYDGLLNDLKKGIAPERGALKKILPAVVFLSEKAAYLQEVSGERYLLKLKRPVIQLQAHFFRYSSVDNSLRSMVMGEGAIFWGIQFSYPQIFQNPQTQEIEKSSSCENEKLFSILRKWVRDTTTPTPFFLPDGKKINAPMRIGKECFSWISNHPDLQAKGLKIG